MASLPMTAFTRVHPFPGTLFTCHQDRLGGQAVVKLSWQLSADCACRSRGVYHVLAMTADRELQPSGFSPLLMHVNGAAHRQSCCGSLAYTVCAHSLNELFLCCSC